MKERMPQILATLAVIAALGVSTALLFIPIYKGLELPPMGVNTNTAAGIPQEISKTLLQVNGPSVLIPLAIPPVLSGAALLAVMSARRWRITLLWVTAFLLTGFVFITGFSIGIYYVPAMILAMTCAIVTHMKSNASGQ